MQAIIFRIFLGVHFSFGGGPKLTCIDDLISYLVFALFTLIDVVSIFWNPVRASIVAERSEARYPFGKRTLDLNSVGPKTPKNAQIIARHYRRPRYQ